MITSAIRIRNPYREGCKLYKIFQFMADGRPHMLDDITNVAYPLFTPGYPDVCDRTGKLMNLPLLRRRTASALRTIRSYVKFLGHVDFDGNKYRLKLTVEKS